MAAFLWPWLTPEFIDERISEVYSNEELANAYLSVTRGSATFWVAEAESGIVGFAYAGDRGQGWELIRLYVLPDHFGEGIGSTLVGLAEGFVQQKGGDRIFCFVHRNNERALAFYRHKGYRRLPEKDKAQPPLMFMEKTLD
ncbi:MAG: GNAT family N-acetyltransferase [Dehalococcoidia bacterium]